MRGSAGGRSAARGVADTGADARSREVALAAMTAQGDRKAAALEKKEATRWPPLPARRVESVRLMFWSSTRLRRPCPLVCWSCCSVVLVLLLGDLEERYRQVFRVL